MNFDNYEDCLDNKPTENEKNRFHKAWSTKTVGTVI